MPKHDPGRREFLRKSGGTAGGAWLALQGPALLTLGQTACQARDSGSPHANLSRAEVAGTRSMSLAHA